MFFLESKTIPDSLSFCCVIALEYSLSFSNLSWNPSLHWVSIQRKEMKFPLMMFRWAVMSVSCMKMNGMTVLMKKFHLKKMFWWSFCILLIHRYIFIGLQLTVNVITIALDSNYLRFRAPLYFPNKWIQRYTETIHWKSLNMKT